MHTYAVK